LFGPHHLYIGAQKVAKWEDSVYNMLIELGRNRIMVPTGKAHTWFMVVIEEGLENSKASKE
jgi:hypothetical protein